MGRRLPGLALASRGMTLVVSTLALLATFGCSGEKKSAKPLGPMKELDLAFQPLRHDFEEAEGKVRLVLVLAPTCGSCLEAANTIHDQLLVQVKSEDLVLFVTWNSVLPTDVANRARRAAEKWADPRALHYWDEWGRIGRAFGRTLELEVGQNAYDCYFLYDRNATWDPEGTMADEPDGHDALKAGWAPVAPRLRMTQNRNIHIANFGWERLATEIDELLAEPQGSSDREWSR